MGPYGSKYFKTLLLAKLYDIQGCHEDKVTDVLVICSKLNILWHFEIFVSTGPYGAGNFKTTPPAVFIRSKPNFMINKAVIRKYTEAHCYQGSYIKLTGDHQLKLTGGHQSKLSGGRQLKLIEISLPRMTPKWPWTLQDQVYPIYITNVPEFQISVLFGLRTSVFELQAILRKVHKMTSKWPWNRQDQMYPIYELLLYPSPKFQSVLHYDHPFRDTGHFKTNALNYPKWPSTLQGQRYLIHGLLIYPSPKFQSVLLYDQPFLRYGPFWDKCTQWPQNDLEHYKVQGQRYSVYVLLVSPSPKFHSVLLQDIAHFIIPHWLPC